MAGDEAAAKRVKRVRETFPCVDGLPLRLSFSPAAIRDHFETGEEVDQLTDAELLQVGAIALQYDELYQTFHSVLVQALAEVAGEPDERE